jgi:glycosyltransferase involved in cell wall biosynthesis
MTRKKVLFICPYPENVAPSQRLKFEQYYPHFRQAGYQVDVSSFIQPPFWKIIYQRGNFLKKVYYSLLGYLHRLRDLFRLRQYDAVYVHLWVTPFGPPMFEWLFKKTARRIVYDIDDLVYLKGAKSQTHPVMNLIKGRNKPIFLMKHADHVITCTPYLDGFVRKFNHLTTDISSTINTEVYRPKESYAVNGTLTIGWSGSHSTAVFLHSLDNMFQELASEIDFKLLVMGDPSFRIPGVNVEAIPWKEEYEVAVISRFDIGVYPLPDEEWVLGKSGLKALQYMALGIPTVATAIGTIFRIIEDGKNGFLVTGKQEWKEKIKALLHSETLRKTIGQNGQKTVETAYSINANKSTYINILDTVTREA